MPCSIPTLQQFNTERFLFLHNSHLELEKNSNNIDIVFIGDSITELFDQNIFNEYFNKFNYLNYGICADQTQHVLYRINNGLFDIIKPKIIILLIGVNNYGSEPENTSKGILQIINDILFKTPNTKIILIGILPFSITSNTKPNNNEKSFVQNVNMIIKNYDNNKNVFYLDMGNKFILENELLNQDLFTDGIHLTTKGYKILTDEIIDKINNLIINI